MGHIMKYKSIVATKRGGPEVLQIIEQDLREPAADEARIKILASSVSSDDVGHRYGNRPFAPKIPFVPGYAIIGIVDALGAGVTAVAVGDRVGALTVTGGYAEYIFLKSKDLFRVPAALNAAQAVPLIENYMTAYQMLHRTARVKAGDKILVIGASGGVGIALLQLGKLANMTMYGTASKIKHSVLSDLGAHPIDYHNQDLVEIVRRAEPGGLDYVFDGVGGDYATRALSLVRRGGKVIEYGAASGNIALMVGLLRLVLVSLKSRGKAFALFGLTGFYKMNKRPYLEDLTKLFKLVEEGKLKPIVMRRFPLLQAASANELQESGNVIGNLVLLALELF
jgi:NADPH:quinone reductase-like Zn-dependent oxidoreductase